MVQSLEATSLKAANESAWYLLATLHGEPDNQLNTSLIDMNRVAWNRWMATAITEPKREKLIATGRYTRAELTPLTEDEIVEWNSLFRARSSGNSNLKLPSPALSLYQEIEISNVSFTCPVGFQGYVFPRHVSASGSQFDMLNPFSECDFLGQADFSKTIFRGPIALFRRNKFHNTACFRDSLFDATASFLSTEFSSADFRNCTFKSHADFFFVVSNDLSDFSGIEIYGQCDL